ncbi:MAG: hypothetical protein KHY35_24155 [Bacteroides thetaiotaomicron]|uniref:Lipoprotein n=1 Tax=Bacteroides thetaiotaomicron TaxID=818 RepID=A0A943HVA6_BACT4|nr:hypothetical protein [Bacteroides thetaiotaomicron]
MKTIKLILSFWLAGFIISSCTSEDSSTSPLVSTSENTTTTRSNGYDLDEPYLTRPDLDPYSGSKDTTDLWVIDVRTDKYINGEYYHGKKGLYKQLQYTTIRNAYESDWKDAVIQIENPIYLRKKNYPFGEIFFRVRTMERKELATIKSDYQYQYVRELSPWSDPLPAINNIYNKDGVSLTKKNVIVEITFTFTASYTGYLWEQDLSNFRASIIYGDSYVSYSVQDRYLKKSGYKETQTLSIDKNYFKNNGLTISVVDRTSPAYYISFDPQLFTLYCNIDEITQPFLFNIDVRLW